MAAVLGSETSAPQQQCVLETQFALAYLMCHVTYVLVCWKLDLDTHSMHTLACSARFSVENYDFVPRCPEESDESHHGQMVKVAAQMQGKAQDPAWRRNVFCPICLRVWV